MATTYEPIATTTLGSPTSTITFSSIPSTYTDLRLVFVALAEAAASGTSPYFRFNNDSAGNYSRTSIWGTGTSALAGSGTNQTQTSTSGAGAGLSTTNYSLWTMDIFSYAGSTYKTCLSTQSSDYNGSGGVDRTVNLWRSTSAINQITVFNVFGNFANGTATLYGIKAA